MQEYYNSPAYTDRIRERIRIIQKVEKDPIERARYMEVWRNDPVAFIETFGFIKIPEFNNETKPFFMFPYQEKIIRKLHDAELSNMEHEILIDKPRGMGITWTVEWYFVWAWVFQRDSSSFILSRTEIEVDDGTLLPDNSIFGKFRWSIAKLPPWLKEGFRGKTGSNRGTVYDMNLKIINPSSGSALIGSTTNSNAGRSKRYSRIMIDECFSIEGFRDVWKALQSVSRLSVYISTVKQGRVYQEFQKLCKDKGDYISLSWKDHPFKDQEWYDEQVKKAEFDPEVMKEIEVDYSVNVKSQYYPEIRDAKCVEGVPYNRKLPLYTALDFGRQDLTVIIWFQWDGKYIYVLDCYSNSKRDVEWYAPFLNPSLKYDPTKYNEFQIKKLDLVRTWEKPKFNFGEPAHKQRVMPLGRSIRDELNKFGIKLIIYGKGNTYDARRRATSVLLPRCIFNSSSSHVMILYDALTNSRYAGAVNSHGTSKESTMKPVHDKEIADYRAAMENGMVNIHRVMRHVSRDTEDDRDHSGVDTFRKNMVNYLSS